VSFGPASSAAGRQPAVLDTKAEPAAAHDPHVTAAPPYAKVEPTQVLQVVDCEARVETDPGAQAEHAAEAAEAEAKPLGHGAQGAPPAEKVPAAQATQAFVPLPFTDQPKVALMRVQVTSAGPAYPGAQIHVKDEAPGVPSGGETTTDAAYVGKGAEAAAATSEAERARE